MLPALLPRLLLIEAIVQTRYDAAMMQSPTSNTDIHVGELYGKPAAAGQTTTIYHVVAVHKQGITLQNMDNPLSQFETTEKKLLQSGYVRLSQTPYVNLDTNLTKGSKRKNVQPKLSRCPYTLDIFADRADYERPQFSQ
jgi:hypothetical protein